MADFISDVFSNYAIDNPEQWLDGQRLAETPDDEVWCMDLFTFPEFSVDSQDGELQVLCERAIPFEEAGKDFDRVARILLGMFDRTKVKLFEVADVEVLMFLSNGSVSSVVWDWILNDFTHRDNDCTAFPWALWRSWKHSKDRERAYKARDYLCNIVAQMLEEEEQLDR
jgi:hypothetical protein